MNQRSNVFNTKLYVDFFVDPFFNRMGGFAYLDIVVC